MHGIDDPPGALDVAPVVCLHASVWVFAQARRPARRRVARVLAGKPSLGKRAPGQDPETFFDAHRHQLPLDLASEHVVLRLQGDRHGESEMPSGHDRSLELPAREVGHADVANLARPDEHVECGEGLLNRRRRVPLVRLIEVDVVGLQSPQAALASANDPTAGQTFGVAGTIHPAATLGRQDDRVAHRGATAQPATDDLLGRALGAHRRIDVGGVDQVSAAIDVGVQDLHRRALRSFLPEGHRPERELRYKHTGSTQQALAHRHPPHPSFAVSFVRLA